MEILSASSQQNDPGQVGAEQPGGQVAQPAARPAIFDTSTGKDVNANTSASAAGLAGGTPNPGSREVSSQSIAVTDPAQAPHADGTRDNVATEFKLGTNGTPIHVASQPVPGSPRDSSQDATQGDVFWRGFKDGATHPGQTLGKISDMASGDPSGSGEKTGTKVDEVLEKLPVVGDGLQITRGIAGEKEADGTPVLVTPNVQPDAEEGLTTSRPAGEPSVSVPSDESVLMKPGKQPAPPEASPVGRERAPSQAQPAGTQAAQGEAVQPPADQAQTAEAQTISPQPAQRQTAQPETTQAPAVQTQTRHPQAAPRETDQRQTAPAEAGKAPADASQARAPGTSAPSTSGTQFDVPAQYASKPAGNLQADPHSPGVFRDDKGQAFIRSGDQTWPVRYDRDNGTWRVYNPDNPTKYQYPVRADENGNWQVHNDVGLKGGGGDAKRPGIGAEQQVNLQQDLQMQRAQLENQRQPLLLQRQDLENQLRQFPGPQHANRTGLEQAQLYHMLQARLADTNRRLHTLDQELQQLQ
ncbi:hypothetical protein [Paraburkholderia sediminicola]|uniref:hypothetical protein n=1 Tax=Paraburkholderia sediminicola TaxID=458836 RepID=UPI0038BBD8BE